MPKDIYINNGIKFNVNTKNFGYRLAYNRLHKNYSHFSINHNYYNSSINVSNIITSQTSRYYSIQVASNKPAIFPYSNSLNPNWITGFADAEASFTVNIVESAKYRGGWLVQPVFSIGLHQKDIAILEQIKIYWGIGNISKHGSDSVRLRIQSIKHFPIILDHFDKYPLITQKRADYELWKRIVEILHVKEPLTRERVEKIVSLKASLNLGLSSELKGAFPNYNPVTRPIIKDQQILDPEWLAGFTSGEGCFLVSIYSSRTKLGVAVKLIFQISQHIRDELILNSFIKFFGDTPCGKIYKDKEMYHYRVTKFSDIYEIIIPFFKKFPIIGVKSKDFKDFCIVADLMKENKHLTPEGLDQIRKIKASMNTGRIALY